MVNPPQDAPLGVGHFNEQNRESHTIVSNGSGRWQALRTSTNNTRHLRVAALQVSRVREAMRYDLKLWIDLPFEGTAYFLVDQ
ncbi:MAG: hypothetical protein DYH08_15050 [Actinobacteria bacterium ATB1]|nr:hypothetical protein [Actinobacteria bacterium ATB1]